MNLRGAPSRSWARKVALACTTIVVAAAAWGGTAAADEPPEESYSYVLDDDGNATQIDSSQVPDPEPDPIVPQDVAPNSPIVGTWYSAGGVVVRFDSVNGYVENGSLGPCAWPGGNLYFRNLRPLSGNNVFAASSISLWSERASSSNGQPTCIGVYDVRYNASVVLTVSGDTLTVGGTNGGVSTYYRVVQDRPTQGYLDGCDAGTCYGWAVDPDFGGAVDVHLYVDGPAGQGQFLGAVRADLASGDVGPHRFAFAHGVNAGRQIWAYGIGRNPDGSSSGANPLLSNAPTTVG